MMGIGVKSCRLICSRPREIISELTHMKGQTIPGGSFSTQIGQEKGMIRLRRYIKFKEFEIFAKLRREGKN